MLAIIDKHYAANTCRNARRHMLWKRAISRVGRCQDMLIHRTVLRRLVDMCYDADGNMTSDGRITYT